MILYNLWENLYLGIEKILEPAFLKGIIMKMLLSYNHPDVHVGIIITENMEALPSTWTTYPVLHSEGL